MIRPEKATHKVRVIHLEDSDTLDDYNEGLHVGDELYAFDYSKYTGSISVMIPSETNPDQESALFKGEYEVIKEYCFIDSE